MPAQKQPSATTISVNDRAFVVHLYSSSQALDVLLTIGEVLAGPLSKVLDREVNTDLGALSEAVGQLQGQEPPLEAIPHLITSLRSSGGTRIALEVLQTTYYEDRLIDSVRRLDQVFEGPLGVVQLIRLCWKVLVYQFGPLLNAFRPTLSGRGEDKEKTTSES